jgi:DNA damage-binding protein 1
MKSMQLLMYKAAENKLEVRARDYNPNWMSAVTMLDDDVYLGGESHCNLFLVKKNSDSAADEERSRLDIVGRIHLGEFVNAFRKGSLVMKLPDSGKSNSRLTIN